MNRSYITDFDHDTWQDAQWVQLNVGLVRHNGQALPSARALFARIEPLVTRWRSDGLLRWFFFMRKPPDVRLRFSTVVEEQQVVAALSEQMCALQREAFIEQFFFSNYQPETNRFGGAEAMKCVHEYFDADTSIWLGLDHLCQRGLRIASPEMLLPTVLHDLFIRGLSDDASVLRAWCTLGALIPSPPEAVIPEVKPLSIERLCSILKVETEESCLLWRYTQINDALAKELISLRSSSQLTCQLVDVLVAVAMFSFHRHGFEGRRSGVLIKAMIRAL